MCYYEAVKVRILGQYQILAILSKDLKKFKFSNFHRWFVQGKVLKSYSAYSKIILVQNIQNLANVEIIDEEEALDNVVNF